MYVRSAKLVVESDGVVAVDVLGHGETVLAVAAVYDRSGESRVGSANAGEVGGVAAVNLE